MPGCLQVSILLIGNWLWIFLCSGILPGSNQDNFPVQLEVVFYINLTMYMNWQIRMFVRLVETGNFGTVTWGVSGTDQCIGQGTLDETELFCILCKSK